MPVEVKETEAERVVRWRHEFLVRHGFNSLTAAGLASYYQGPDYVDIHYAVELLEQTGDESLVCQIIAPDGAPPV